MAVIDKKYHKLLEKILNEGDIYEDPNRKGINRIQIPDYKIKHDFKDGFPALTTKKLYWKGIVGELLWILRGDTNIKYLVNNNINIWNKDAHNFFKKDKKNKQNLSDEEFIELCKHRWSKGWTNIGDVGRNYGAQLRNWNNPIEGQTVKFTAGKPIDQLTNLINTLRTNPMATKKTVTFWNPAEADKTALTPCHWSFEVLVEPYYDVKPVLNYNDGLRQMYQLSIKWHQHSVDTFLGLPFNIGFYATLTHILAKLTNMIPKRVIGDFSNVHIYEPHLDAVKQQLKNDPTKYTNIKLKPFSGFKMDMHGDIDQWLSSKDISDFKLDNYKSYPKIEAEMLPYNK